MEKLIRYRKKMGMTQQDLAEKSGYSRSSIINWETGKRAPRTVDIEKLAAALGTTVGALMGEDEDEPDAPTIESSEEQPSMRKLLQLLSSFAKKNEDINKEENNNLKVTPFPDPLKPNELGLAYWGSVVDNARRVASNGNAQDKEIALMMLRMAADAITGAESKPTGENFIAVQ